MAKAKSVSRKKAPLAKTSISAFSPKKFDVKHFDLAHFTSTKEIPVPKSLVEQVIGQDKSVEIIRKAAAQKRNVLLVGLPGTGKSLLAQAMSEILPVGLLQDVLIYPNQEDPNNPKVRVMKAGEGKKVLEQGRLESAKQDDSMRLISLLLPIGWMVLSTILWQLKWYPDVVYAALIVVGGFLLVATAVGGQMRVKEGSAVPKLLINNLGKKTAPFFEATGSRAGALLGDVRHDPLQSFYGFNGLYLLKEGRKSSKLVKKPINMLWDEMFSKYKMEIIRNEKGHEAIMLPTKEKVFTLGYKNGKVILSRVLSLNRQPYSGEMVEISVDNKKIIVTPEHKVFTKKETKHADKISEKDSLFKLSPTIA